jgi:hypothetical protein
MSERAAYCLCCAIESATNLRPAILSSSLVKVAVVRVGTPSRGLGGSTLSSSGLEVIVASDEARSGGRLWDEEGFRRGVEVFELSVEEGRTRFARRNEKNALAMY